MRGPLRYKKLFLTIALVFLVAGCATTPGAGGPFPYPTVSMHQQAYVALPLLCERDVIAWDYDPLSKVLILKKDKQELKLLVGSRMIMAQDALRELTGPVEILDSVVYAPIEVREYLVPAVCKFPEKAAGPLYLKEIRSIVVDAGHGGKDPGAIGKQGLREKDVVLDVARKVERELGRCGLSVTTTRSSDEYIQVAGRPEIANKMKADLFVSIHANANLSRWIEGFEVYYLTEAVDDDARALAAAENAPLEIEDTGFSGRFASLKATLWDLVYTENRRESIELAHFISKSVSRRMSLKTLGVKGAPFAVLKGSRMPAVLVEIGYLSNRDGEKNLRDPQYRQAMAEAIAEGIMDFKNYCEGRRQN